LGVFENESKLVRIEENGFSGSGLTHILIPWSVEVLGMRCFLKCRSLVSIAFEPNSRLVRIEEAAFSALA
jgi:hypothetical protein